MSRGNRNDGFRVSRRQTLGALGAVGTVSLAGCSQSGASSGGGDSSPTTVTWWHAMGGNLGETVEQLASDFNEQSDDIRVETSYKGSYTENLNSTISAVRGGEPPTISQVFDVGSTLAIDSGFFQPIDEVMDIDWSRYHDPVIDYYTFDGQINSLPFNSSNPILYYNKDAFREAGLDPEAPPESFAEIRQFSETLVESGATKWGAAIPNASWLVEQWFALDDQPLVNNGNGRDSHPTEINYDTETARRIFGWWVDMYEDELVPHTGKGDYDAAAQLLFEGTAGMTFRSTAGVASTVEAAAENDFELGTGFYPVPHEGTRAGVVIGGASLWLVDDIPDAQKEAAQVFFEWLSESEQQAAWHRGTGYFPITKDAVDLLRDEGWFEDNPNFRTAFDQLNDTELTTATQGWQAGPHAQIRDLHPNGYVEMIETDVGVEEKLSEMKTEGDRVLQEYIDSQ